ncbi:unnamed protein product [Symbiodinium sp. CCMP2592]|nr:unnamed protein product [Symbiodinium sp. CCMP2592]
MASLVPKKPTTPPPSKTARRQTATTAPRHVLSTTRSNSSPGGPLPKQVWSVSNKMDVHGKSYKERSVHFAEVPQIILFLSAPDDGKAEDVPGIRSLAAVVEEDERDDGNHEVVPAPPDPVPKDSCEGGLAALVAVERLDEVDSMEAPELRQLCGALLRQRRELQSQLAEREASCTRLLSENSELRALHSRLFGALEREGLDVEELLKEDERKLRTAKVERQLEEELRELHGLVAEQQKQLDAALTESQGLRRELEASQRFASKETTLPSEVANESIKAQQALEAARPASASEEEEAPDPLPNPPAEPRRPWPLRTVRKAVAPLRPAAAKPQPVRLQIRFMPAAASSVSGRPVHKTQVSVHTSAPPTEVLRLLLDQGLAWPASLAPAGEEFGLPGHLLFHGKLLDEGKPLVEQGIQDGCELRLVKGPKVHAPVRCPRGLLMNAHPWEPGKIGQKAGVTAPPDV